MEQLDSERMMAGVFRRIGTYLSVAYCLDQNVTLSDGRRRFQGSNALEQSLGEEEER